MSSVYIIAEAGVNHNGSLEMAKKLIEVAANAGADAVKFQTFNTEKVISKFAEKAEYQKQATNEYESQYEMVKKLELSKEDFKILREHCSKFNIDFLSTPFDLDSVDFLADDMELPIIKIPSGEITNAPLLLRIARKKKRVILSTGMSTIGEIEDALGVLAFGYISDNMSPSRRNFEQAYISEEGQISIERNVSLLHCTTEYPAPFEDINLKGMLTLGNTFNLKVGLSDHSAGIAIPIAAATLGAAIIEKHFTLDKTLPGPDHQASLEPTELVEMIRYIRQTELALGNSIKKPRISEIKNIPIARKSLVASKMIKEGEIFTENNITTKRPGIGISPMYYWDMIGKRANRSYAEDEVIDPRCF